MRFDGDYTVIYQCEKEDKEASGFLISHFYWSFTSDITAVKGLSKLSPSTCWLRAIFLKVVLAPWLLVAFIIIALYSPLSSRLTALMSNVILNEWLYYSFLWHVFECSTGMVYLQRCMIVTRLVPRETAAVSARPVYTHAQRHVTSCKTHA